MLTGPSAWRDSPRYQACDFGHQVLGQHLEVIHSHRESNSMAVAAFPHLCMGPRQPGSAAHCWLSSSCPCDLLQGRWMPFSTLQSSSLSTCQLTCANQPLPMPAQSRPRGKRPCSVFRRQRGKSRAGFHGAGESQVQGVR